MLEKFKQGKKEEIERLISLKLHKGMPAPLAGNRQEFLPALRNPGCGSVIAEYKPASPSKGTINTSSSVHQTACLYKRGKAAAISVLTEEKYFCSSTDFLFQAAKTGLPVMRKDFIFHPLQVEFTASTPASAILLIVRIFAGDLRRFENLYAFTCQTGLQPVVEVFDRDDLEAARDVGAGIIQVNNRDLQSMRVDLDVSRKLICSKKENEIWISASGIENAHTYKELIKLGFNACLIGTWLMQSTDPVHCLQSMQAPEVPYAD